MSALLPKSLLSRLSALAGLGAAPAVEEEEEKRGEEAPEADDKASSPHAADADSDRPSSSSLSPPQPQPPLELLDDQALTLSLDHLPPRDLATLSLASWRFSSVSRAGDAWRLRFCPRLPKEVVARLDAAESLTFGFGWPCTYAALALSNLLRSSLEWDGVAHGMRAATAAASEASASSPAWRVSCHGGHGFEVERDGPAGSEPFAVSAVGEKERWPPALMPRSALASSRGAGAGAAAPAARSWLPLPRFSLSSPSGSSAPPRPLPLSVAASFSWCELVQEVDLVFELLRATSWVSSSSASSSGATTTGEEEEEKEAENGGGGEGKGDEKDKKSRKKKISSPNLCWTRSDAEAYLDSNPSLVLSFSCASRKDCESSLSAALLALPDLKETGPLPPYHGRANYDWKSRAQALAVSEFPERSAPWGETGSKAGHWERMTLSPLKLPPKTRRALVVLRSKDSRFWSGHYGAKLAAPVLAFAATDRELEEAEEAAEETERGREAAAAGRELLFAA